jgi:uncharacterized membrane protein YkoI
MVFALFLIVWSAGVRADEESVPLDKVPKAVMDTFKARFKDARPTGASKETVEGKVLYEVTFKDKGKNVDVTITAKGELVSIEREIAAKDLPKAVAKALQDKYPKATYRIAEELIEVKGKKETLTSYEVLLVAANKQAWEVVVTPAGKITKEEKKDLKKDK